MELAASQAYANFRAWVPRNIIPVGVRNPQSWLYYDWGPRSYPEPILFFHSLIGSPESFFYQVISLAPRGYRVLSIQIPVYWTIVEFCESFHAFLEMLDISRFHVYGAGLGGFLALHYAVQKPDRIASIILTHSFLSTENITHTVPYSAAVLRWLPSFFVQSTMRAMLPKGRTSLEQANAAEFAIGHTMTVSRELLASRLALFVTSSTVVSRLHIPESRITIIDTLDRLPGPLQLSERTASHLKGARRAFLKHGGDFPFLSVPDEVIVHLVVHLRRHAPNPTAPMPVPPPARPHPLPESAIQRKREEAMRMEAEKNENMLSTPPSAIKPRRLHDDLLTEARAIVAADERAIVERFSIEIKRLRDFLPERDDSYIAAVISECDGNVEDAISNVVDGLYDDSFYHEIHARSIDNAILLLRQAEGDPLLNDYDENVRLGEGSRSDIDDHESNINIHGVAEPKHNANDPLGGSGVALNGQDDVPDVRRGVDRGADIASDEEAHLDGTVLSPSVKSIDRDDGTDGRSDTYEGLGDDDGGDGDDERRVNGSSTSRKRRARRRSSSAKSSDAMEAYVTSERVGMRSSGTFIGRGPAPFKSPTVQGAAATEESWLRSSARSEGDQDGEIYTEDVGSGGRVSGASLLGDDKNPLDFSEEGKPSASPDHRRNSEGEGLRENDDDVLFSWDGVIPEEDSGITALGPEISEGTNPLESKTVGSDGWGPFGLVDKAGGGSGNLAPSEGENGGSLDNGGGVEKGEPETEEQRRLRMWSMSAIAAAFQTVQR